jgi:RNA polymerase sigma-70 factor (ECF subfamily)
MERTAFILRHMEDQPIQVIADALGVQHSSAKQAIFRAVAKLRRELAPTARAAASIAAPSLNKDSQ